MEDLGFLGCGLAASVAMIILFVSIQTIRAGELQGLVFYVSTDGNDLWSGKIASPNPQETDGPYATVERAQRAVREARAQQELLVTVLIRGGVYELNQPLVFGHEDGGSEGSPVTYAAYPGERPVFSGGSPVKGWQRGEGPVWAARIPQVERGEWYFCQLFANGQRQTRARTPNEGYLRIASTLPLGNLTGAQRDMNYKIGFCYREGDLQRWGNLQDVNVFLYHSWTCSVHWVESLNEENRTLRFTSPCDWPIAYWDPQQRYHLENYLEALDSPGEWYLDRGSGILYFWPPDSQDPNDLEVVAPRLQHLLILQRSPEGLTVNHLILRGLSFQYADWKLDKDKAADGQAATSLSAAVVATGTRDCVLEECEIAHVGEYGVVLGEGCKDTRIVHCEIHDLGGGGVRIGQGGLPKEPENQTDHNTVDNCFIHDGGHVFRAGVGVWIGRSSYNTVSHNEICDFYYSGCSVGWSWGYDPSSAHDNILEYNHIHDLGKGVLSDMGGIYTLGISPGTVERYNLIHDIYSYSYGGWGLYTDEGSTNIILEGNVVYNTKSGSFHQHYGRENLLRNNILGPALEATIIRTREEEHISFTLEHNIVMTSNRHVLGGAWKNGNYKMDYNLHWDLNDILGEDMDFGGLGFQAWQATGHDQHSTVGNPLFVDAEHHDYRLQSGSPALDLGFQPPDIGNAGLYGEIEWVEAPKKIVRATLTQFLPPARVRSGPASYPENLSQSDTWIISYDPAKGTGTIPLDPQECTLVWRVDWAKLPSNPPRGSQTVNGSCQSSMKKGLGGQWYVLIGRQDAGALSLKFRDGMSGGNWDDNNGRLWWATSGKYVQSLLSELERVNQEGTKYGADMSAFAACATRANAHYLQGNYGEAMNEIDGNLNAAGLEYARQLLNVAGRELESLRGKGFDLALDERLLALADLMIEKGLYGSAESYCMRVLVDISNWKASIPENQSFAALFLVLLLVYHGKESHEGRTG